jgi:hypothetical protein
MRATEWTLSRLDCAVCGYWRLGLASSACSNHYRRDALRHAEHAICATSSFWDCPRGSSALAKFRGAAASRHVVLSATRRRAIHAAHDADVVPVPACSQNFLIIQRYQRSTPIIAKCGNDREPGTGSRRFCEDHRIAVTKLILMKALPHAGKEKSCRGWIALQR